MWHGKNVENKFITVFFYKNAQAFSLEFYLELLNTISIYNFVQLAYSILYIRIYILKKGFLLWWKIYMQAQVELID